MRVDKGKTRLGEQGTPTLSLKDWKKNTRAKGRRERTRHIPRKTLYQDQNKRREERKKEGGDSKRGEQVYFSAAVPCRCSLVNLPLCRCIELVQVIHCTRIFQDLSYLYPRRQELQNVPVVLERTSLYVLPVLHP